MPDESALPRRAADFSTGADEDSPMPKPKPQARRHDHPDLERVRKLRAAVDAVVATRDHYTPVTLRLAAVHALGADALPSPALVADLRAMPPLADGEQARVHGAVDGDPPELIAVLFALEEGESLSEASRLAAAAFAPDDNTADEILRAGGKSRHRATERIRKLADPESRADRELRAPGAYERWRASVASRLAGAKRIAGYPAERIERLRVLVEKHRR